MLFTTNTAVDQEVMEAAIMITLLILYLHTSDEHQHRVFNRSRAENLL